MPNVEINSLPVPRLKTAFARARISNPEISGLVSPTPTLAQASTPDGTLTKIYKMDQAQSVMAVTGGRFYYSTTNQRGAVSTQNVAGDVGNLNFLSSPTPTVPSGEGTIGPYYFKFMTDAQVVQIAGAALATGLPHRFIVDGQYIDTAGNDFFTNIYYKISFGTKKPRLIEIECQWAFSFFQVAIDPKSRIWKPRPQEPIRGAITGDSHTENFSGIPTTAWNGCSAIMARMLGIWDFWVTSIGGTGYLKTGTSGLRKTIRQQMADWVNIGKYDIIIFAGGYNDLGFSTASVTAEALLCWKLARASQANAVIVVFGIWGAARGPDSTLTTMETALATTFAAWGDRNSVFIPVSSPPAGQEAWEFGTNYSGVSNLVAGNSDNYVSADGVHCLLAGHQHRGYRMANAIADAVYGM